MEEAYNGGNRESSDSSFEDDIYNVSLLPDRKRKPRKYRRRKIRIFEDNSLDRSGRMCSRRTVVYSSITAVLLVSIVLIAVFVNPSSSNGVDETKTKRESQFEDESEKSPYQGQKPYKDTEGKIFGWQKIRLPNSLVPVEYLIKLHPNLETFKYTGVVTILVDCKEDTSSVLLHAKKMKLEDVEVKKTVGKMEALTVGKRAESLKLEMHSFEVLEGLVKGEKYSIGVTFSAVLSDKLAGFYKSSYKNEHGKIRYLATTHFEPTDARAAFPCFDEPAKKAVFKIVMVRKKEYHALSNMPVQNTTTRPDGLLEDHFQPSVKMSTYLVAFVVSDFASKESKTVSGTKVRVWAPPNQINEADFALSEAVKILHYYETFFAVPFPLPKLDLIAIPDFGAGAMENWGLIMYRLTSLLYNEKESSDSSKQWVAVVVAHELAHQWFGNLVTMKWWNDLWLNEGFASFVENIGANYTNPNWRMMDQFLLDKTQRAMNLDQMSNSHPISVVVTDPNQINSLFDTISYDKGAAIIGMLKSFLGEHAFKTGLQKYLNTHKFGNAETNELWAAFSKTSKQYNAGNFKDVKSVMDTWTLQMGFPVVTIKRSTGNKAIASQKHFLIHPEVQPALPSKFNYKWIIPFTYCTQNDKKKRHAWIEKDNVEFEYPTDAGWIKANVGQYGYYRVNYEDENWRKLTEQINTKHEVFSAADRAGLIDDAFDLARSGNLSLTKALDLTVYLTKEREYVPWAAAISNLGYIDTNLCQFPEDFVLYKKYVVQQLIPTLHHLGWKDEGTHLQKYLRSTVLRLGSEYDEKNASAAAVKMFDDWMIHGKRIPPNLRSLVYSAGVRAGGEEEFNFMYKKYTEARVASEKKTLMFALTTTRKRWLLEKLLKMSLDKSKIRSQDTVSVITSVASNCHGRSLAWEFVTTEWDTLFLRYGYGSFDFSRLILRTTSHFNTEEKLNEIEAFFKIHKLGSARRAVQQSLESIKANAKWMKKHKEEVLDWFVENTHPKPAESSNHEEEPAIGIAEVEKLSDIIDTPKEYERLLEEPEYRQENQEYHRDNQRSYSDNGDYYHSNGGYRRDNRESEFRNRYDYNDGD